jgi:RND family efflux transporter MFP subunit
MKAKKYIIGTIITLILVGAAVVKLVSNKRNSAEQLKMATEFATTIPVSVDTVRFRQLPKEFTETGTFLSYREISIMSETQGKVISVGRKTGDHVKAGQVLASTDTEVLESQVETARYNLEKAAKDLHRFETLSESDAATAQQCEMARQNYLVARSTLASMEKQLGNACIRAPFDGIIVHHYVETGTYLYPGSPAFEIIDISKVKLMVRLTPGETESIREGQKVRVEVDACKAIEGTVSVIGDKADLSMRYPVEIEVANLTEPLLKPGMSGTAVFSKDSISPQLVIPRRALTGSIRNPQVYLVKGDSVVLQQIEAIPFDDKNILLNSGLQAGDVIVISGQINLVNGSRISITL